MIALVTVFETRSSRFNAVTLQTIILKSITVFSLPRDIIYMKKLHVRYDVTPWLTESPSPPHNFGSARLYRIFFLQKKYCVKCPPLLTHEF